MEIESTFHMYVQPVVHPQLTPFCTEVRAAGRGALGLLVHAGPLGKARPNQWLGPSMAFHLTLVCDA